MRQWILSSTLDSPGRPFFVVSLAPRQRKQDGYEQPMSRTGRQNPAAVALCCRVVS